MVECCLSSDRRPFISLIRLLYCSNTIRSFQALFFLSITIFRFPPLLRHRRSSDIIPQGEVENLKTHILVNLEEAPPEIFWTRS
jgi:hypothetical protein